MSSNRITGRGMIAALKIAGTYYPIFCAKTAIFNIDQDMIETTSVNSSSGREFVPGMTSATLDCGGVSVLDNTGGQISNLYLMQQAIRRTLQNLRALFTAENGSQIGATFNGYFKSGSESKDVNSFLQSQVSFQITGGITFSSTIDPPVAPTADEENPIFDTLADGSTTYTNALLIQGVGHTLTILTVTRSGLTYHLTSGTPGNLEFKYTSGTGVITFRDAGNPVDPSGNLEPITINYKISTP